MPPWIPSLVKIGYQYWTLYLKTCITSHIHQSGKCLQGEWSRWTYLKFYFRGIFLSLVSLIIKQKWPECQDAYATRTLFITCFNYSYWRALISPIQTPVGRPAMRTFLALTQYRATSHTLWHTRAAHSHLVQFPIDPSPSVSISTLSESISVTSLRSNCFSFRSLPTPLHKFVMLHGRLRFKKQEYPYS
jgi:hypothetical protein